MANSFYNHTGTPVTQSLGLSHNMRTEFGLVGLGFDRVAQAIGGSGMRFGNVITLIGSAALTTNEAGSEMVYNSANAGTVTLPNPLSVTIGTVFAFTNINNGIMTVNRFGTDLIYAGGALAGRSSVQLRRGQWLVLAANGTDWVEAASNLDPVIDLTGYSGPDIALAVRQQAVYDLTAVNTLSLRIATATDQEYTLTFNPNLAVNVTLAGNPVLRVNNVDFGSNQCVGTRADISDGNVVVGTTFTAPSFFLCNLGRMYRLKVEICTRTAGKTVMATYTAASATSSSFGTIASRCGDTTTVWSSLGLIGFNDTVTGRVTVTRTA